MAGSNKSKSNKAGSLGFLVRKFFPGLHDSLTGHAKIGPKKKGKKRKTRKEILDSI